jgi:hypothetical protein
MWLFVPLAGLLLGALAPSGEALAQEPIHGCVSERSGRVRVVAVGSQCTYRETSVEFAAEGPVGPAGPPGPPGPPGPSIAAPDPLPPEEEYVGYELAGFTSASFTGAQGVLAFTLACQSEFADSRMCTSEEVLNTVDVPMALSGTAWVRPTYVEGGHDMSGVEDSAEHFTCKGWTFDGNKGLTVNEDGKFDTLICSNRFQVACCTEIP